MKVDWNVKWENETNEINKTFCGTICLMKLWHSQVYHLVSVRLRDLCAKLDISSELRRKIWTCFEYSLVHCTDMMMDRHLDQLLMCAVYVMAKVCARVCVCEDICVCLFQQSITCVFCWCQVTKDDRSFQNIMKCYRTQPQASSNVRSSWPDTHEENSHTTFYMFFHIYKIQRAAHNTIKINNNRKNTK